MGNGKSRFFEDPPYRPQMTEKQVAEMRAVFDRGLYNKEPAVEALSTFYDFENRTVSGCTDDFPFDDLSRKLEYLSKQELAEQELFNRFDPEEIRRFAKLGASYITFRNRTPCLLRVAALAEMFATNELFLNSPDTFFDLVWLIVEVSEVLIKRTKAKYRFFADSQDYLPVDKAVLTISPIRDYPNWKSLYDQRKKVMARKALVLTPVPVEEAPVGLEDEKSWQTAMDEVERRLDSDRVTAEITRAATGDMPEVNKRIQNLKILKFSDIESQTRAKYSSDKKDDPLHKHVELMIYHSVYSVILDKEGNPAFLSHFPYAFMIPDAGVPMQRRMQPEGLWVSTGRYADYHLEVKGRTVRSILFGGIGGLIEPGAGFSWEHDLHTRLQSYINWNSFHVVPVIVVSEAFGSDAFSISKARSKFDEIIERTGRYLYAEVVRRLSNLYENYEEILLDLTEQIVKDIIVDRVKHWAREYIIKKIGKKLIPGLNLISLISELRDKEETDRTRAAVACIVMSVKSTRTDDLTISSKVLAKIGIDKVQEAAVEAIQNKAEKVLVRKVESAVKPKAKAKPKPEATQPQPQPEPPAAQPDPAAKKPDAPPTDPNIARGTSDPRTQRTVPTREEIERGRRLAEEFKKGQAQAKADADAAEQKRRQGTQPGEAKPAGDKPADPKATGAAAVDSKTTDGKSTDSTSTEAKGRDVRGTPKKRKEPPPEPPLPPSTATPRETLDFFKKNKEHYPKDIQDRINAEVEKAAQRRPGASKKAVVDINKAIEAENAKGGTRHPPVPKNLSADQRLEYLKQNRNNYPPDVRKKIDAEIAKSTEREASAGTDSLANIDAAIKEDHARVLTIHYGIPIETVKRRQRHAKGENKGEDTPGTDTEKTNISERTGKRPELSAVSKTKDGEEVEIDDLYVDNDGKLVAREHKSSLDIKGKTPDELQRDIQGRMDKQARWSEDYNVSRYEWVYHSKDDAKKMIDAKAALLEQANSMSDTKIREKLLERYKKIVIIPYPYDE